MYAKIDFPSRSISILNEDGSLVVAVKIDVRFLKSLVAYLHGLYWCKRDDEQIRESVMEPNGIMVLVGEYGRKIRFKAN